jgi:aspartyl/asparaginyl beta-hydroxylase (cupin superfamily)
MNGASQLIAEADRATASGDLHRARDLLLQAVEQQTPDISTLLKLAGLQRATGKTQIALDTVERALQLNPLDFTALLLRASLLQQLDRPGTPQAWSHALAQRPAGKTPPHLSQVVAEAEARVEKWTADREAKMASAMQSAEAAADPEERERIQRFRSNVLRRTRPYHSEPTHFHFPGLAEREFFPRRLFPCIEALERETDAIAAEMQAVMAAERANLVPYIQYAEHLPLDQWRELNNNRDWTAIHLLRNGETVPANAGLCPRTMSLLVQCDQPRITGASPNAMFSLLAPGTHIPPHVGVNNTRLVCHLPLVVPEGCWFRVGAETRFWKPGEAFVFDDTIEHEAMNPTDQLRVVFIFDVWHPDLTSVEREAVTALLESERDAPSAGL